MRIVGIDPHGVFSLAAEEVDQGERVDKALVRVFSPSNLEVDAEIPVLSRSKICALIDAEKVKVNQHVLQKVSSRLAIGDLVEVLVGFDESDGLIPNPAVAFEIVYEDSALAVIDKPPGLVVHPGNGNQSATLVHGLLARLNGLELSGDRAGIVHRLDKDTSGLMVVAKTQRAYQGLISQFLPPRKIKRQYTALCWGAPRRQTRFGADKNSGIIELAIARHPTRRTQMSVQSSGRAATTYWKIVSGVGGCFELELTLDTGRTHQIRVHLQSTGAAILGDPVYGPPQKTIPVVFWMASCALGRQALHASALEFIHPVSGETVSFKSVLPSDMRQFKKALGFFGNE